METNRRTTKLTREQRRKLIIGIILAAAVIAGAVLLLRRRVETRFGGRNEDSVTSAAVTRGSISTSVYSSGLLADDDVEEFEIPAGVELTEILVRPGDSVSEGDILAAVDTGTVLAALNSVSTELEALDSELKTASSSTVASYIYTSVPGRVKKIYIAAGDSVTAAMYDNGALMLLSLDGYMAVDIAAEGLEIGESVTAQCAAGAECAGTVASVGGGRATILVDDSVAALGERVTVTAEDGRELGSGEAYLHDELKITGYTGTAAYISVAEGSYVYSGATLMTLSDTGYSAAYSSLLSERAELEETLTRLIGIYKQGAVCAEISGTIAAVDAVEADEATDEDASAAQYISISPDSSMSISVGVDESEILSVSIGQSAEVTVDAIDDASFTGEVTEIDRAGVGADGVTTYYATVSIPKSAGMLSGMSASATIKIDGVENALLIPTDALNKTADGYYVYTAYDEQSGELGGMVEVTIGVSNSNFTEISTGLSEGDTVYYTEKEDDAFAFMPGGMMPGGNGGGMPSGGGDFGGGGAPGGGGGMPSGGFGGGMPGGRG